MRPRHPHPRSPIAPAGDRTGGRSALRFGIRFNSDLGPIPRVVELARLAEAAGFDDVWVCHDLLKRDAWVTLAAIAARRSTPIRRGRSRSPGAR